MDSYLTYPPIDISFPRKQFENHLGASGENRRIIFSGPFGSGKTYFLKEYFGNHEKFIMIRLAPVNYSISSNEDVFELIKFDILFQILEKSMFPKTAEITREFVLQNLFLFDLEKGILGILEKADKVCVNILEHLGGFNLAPERVYDFNNNLSPKITLNQAAKEFIEKISKKPGGVYERNLITRLLYYLIAEIGSEQKEIVLVIDDLDRMDPEHIFRILNVFAAHFDIDNEENKFGFDRIVLVCDLKNIRNIFSSRYGQDVDFSGYIDKFYSNGIFIFDNSRALKKEISRIVLNVKASPEFVTKYLPYDSPQNYSHKFIANILNAFINVNAINLRSIRRSQSTTFNFSDWVIDDNGYSPKNFEIVWILNFLRIVFGDGNNLIEALKRCVAAKLENEIFGSNDNFAIDYYINSILSIFVIGNKDISGGVGIYELEGKGVAFHFEIKNNRRVVNEIYVEIIKIIDANNNEVPSHSINLFVLLLNAAEKVQKLGWLK